MKFDFHDINDSKNQSKIGDQVALALIIIISAFTLLRHIQTADLTLWNVYFERDAYRSAGFTEGRIIFFGPELWGGGNTPGPFYYVMNAIQIAFIKSPLALVYSAYVQLFLAAILFFFVCKKYFGSLSALISSILLVTNNYMFLDFKLAWNPSHSLLLNCLLLFFVMRFFCDRKSEIDLYVMAFLTGLLSQIHLSFGLIEAAILFLILFDRDLGWRHACLSLAAFILPMMPYTFFYFSTGHDLEPPTGQSYDQYMTYYQSIRPSALIHTLTLLFASVPGAIYKKMAFLSAIWPSHSELVMWISAAARSLIGGCVALVITSVIASKWLQPSLSNIGENLQKTVNRLGDRPDTILIPIVLVIVPSILFYPFVGDDGSRPFHYHYILLLPTYMLFGAAITRSIGVLNKKWTGVKSLAIQFVAWAVLAGFAIISIVGLAIDQRLKLDGQAHNLPYYADIATISNHIINTTGISPEEFPERVYFNSPVWVVQFPFAYASFARNQMLDESYPPRRNDIDGVFIDRIGNFDEIQKIIPLKILSRVELPTKHKAIVYLYRFTDPGLPATAMSNQFNPYMHPDIGEVPWNTASPPQVFQKTVNKNVELSLNGLMPLSQLPLFVRAGVRLENEGAVLDTQLHSPALTGFSPESGRSGILVRPRITVTNEIGKERDCRLYFENQLAGLRYPGSVGDDGNNNETRGSLFNAPLRQRCVLSGKGPWKITFNAERLINARSGGEDLEISLFMGVLPSPRAQKVTN